MDNQKLILLLMALCSLVATANSSLVETKENNNTDTTRTSSQSHLGLRAKRDDPTMNKTGVFQNGLDPGNEQKRPSRRGLRPKKNSKNAANTENANDANQNTPKNTKKKGSKKEGSSKSSDEEGECSKKNGAVAFGGFTSVVSAYKGRIDSTWKPAFFVPFADNGNVGDDEDELLEDNENEVTEDPCETFTYHLLVLEASQEFNCEDPEAMLSSRNDISFVYQAVTSELSHKIENLEPGEEYKVLVIAVANDHLVSPICLPVMIDTSIADSKIKAGVTLISFQESNETKATFIGNNTIVIETTGSDTNSISPGVFLSGFDSTTGEPFLVETVTVFDDETEGQVTTVVRDAYPPEVFDVLSMSFQVSNADQPDIDASSLPALTRRRRLVDLSKDGKTKIDLSKKMMEKPDSEKMCEGGGKFLYDFAGTSASPIVEGHIEIGFSRQYILLDFGYKLVLVFRMEGEVKAECEYLFPSKTDGDHLPYVIFNKKFTVTPVVAGVPISIQFEPEINFKASATLGASLSFNSNYKLDVEKKFSVGFDSDLRTDGSTGFFAKDVSKKPEFTREISYDAQAYLTANSNFAIQAKVTVYEAIGFELSIIPTADFKAMVQASGSSDRDLETLPPRLTKFDLEFSIPIDIAWVLRYFWGSKNCIEKCKKQAICNKYTKDQKQCDLCVQSCADGFMRGSLWSITPVELIVFRLPEVEIVTESIYCNRLKDASSKAISMEAGIVLAPKITNQAKSKVVFAMDLLDDIEPFWWTRIDGMPPGWDSDGEESSKLILKTTMTPAMSNLDDEFNWPMLDGTIDVRFSPMIPGLDYSAFARLDGGIITEQQKAAIVAKCTEEFYCKKGTTKGVCATESSTTYQEALLKLDGPKVHCPDGFKCCSSETPICNTLDPEQQGTCREEQECRSRRGVPRSDFDECPVDSQICCVPADLCSVSDGLYQGECIDSSVCEYELGVSVENGCSQGIDNFGCCLKNDMPECLISDMYAGYCADSPSCIFMGNTPLYAFSPGFDCESNMACCVSPPICTSQVKGDVTTRVTGSCVHKSSCSPSHDLVANLCQGGAGPGVECCLDEPLPSCAVNGIEGQCMDITKCKGQIHFSTGQCPGGSEIACCTELNEACADPNGEFSGRCTWPRDCDTTVPWETKFFIPDMGCSGDGTVKCCVEERIPCRLEIDGVVVKEGSCQFDDDCDTEESSEIVLEAECPTGSNTKCCVSTGASTCNDWVDDELQGSGVCKETELCDPTTHRILTKQCLAKATGYECCIPFKLGSCDVPNEDNPEELLYSGECMHETFCDTDESMEVPGRCWANEPGTTCCVPLPKCRIWDEETKALLNEGACMPESSCNINSHEIVEGLCPIHAADGVECCVPKLETCSTVDGSLNGICIPASSSICSSPNKIAMVTETEGCIESESITCCMDLPETCQDETGRPGTCLSSANECSGPASWGTDSSCPDVIGYDVVCCHDPSPISVERPPPPKGTVTPSGCVNKTQVFDVEVVVEGAGGLNGTRTVPIEVVFSLDSSGSMFSNDRGGIRKSASINFLNNMNNQTDYGGLVSWDSSIEFTTKLTQDFEFLKTQINRVDSSGGTNLNLGLTGAIDVLAASTLRAAARAIIFLTDGGGSYTNCANNGPAKQAADENYKIYSVGLGSSVSESLLRDMADCSNGTFTPADQAADRRG